ncbi:hypothetical protein EUTSA_v10002913mg, partial [Eutrema salsugineum]
DVKPPRTGWKVQVNWESLEIILADEMGIKIHATVKKNLLHRFERMMVVASGQYRTTRHQFKMSFISSTVFRKCSNRSDSLFFYFSEFVTRLDDVTNTSFLVDVIGQVESVYELQTISVMNKDTSQVEFALRMLSDDERLPCTLWGKLGEEVYSACRSAGERSVILVICFGKINVFKGDRRITSSCQTTKVLIDLNDPDVIVFKNRVSYGDEINFDQFPMVTISELQDYLEIMCTIYAVDTDWSWFYFFKKDKKMIKKNKTLYSCECDAKVSFVSARYKLHLCVMDDNSKIKCFLFDRNQKADEILKENFDEFLIGVEKENLYGGSNTYKVGKVWKENDVLSADKVNESEDMSDQSLLLSDIVDNHFENEIKVHSLFAQILVDRTNIESLTRTHNQFSPTVCDGLENCKSS